MTVSSGNGRRLDEPRERGQQVAVSGPALLVLEPEPVGSGARAAAEILVVGLREIEHPPVVAEVLLEESGMTIEAQAADHDRIEVPREEVGEVEGRRLRVVQLLPGVFPARNP